MNIRVSDIIAAINRAAPEYTQQSWDNTGLNVGALNAEVKRVLLCVDVLPEVVDEAIQSEAQMIISHHPLLFAGVKHITTDAQSVMLKKLIKHDIALYSSHTAFDVSPYGTNAYLAKQLELQNLAFLDDISDIRCCLRVLLPAASLNTALEMLGEAEIHAFVQSGSGDTAEITATVFSAQSGALLRKLRRAVPKFNYTLSNISAASAECGMGLIGSLSRKMSGTELVEYTKKKLGLCNLRVSSDYRESKIGSLALCTGSGAEYVKTAAKAGADAYLCADLKWSDFLDARKMGLMLLCPSHFETERCFINAMDEILHKELGEISILASKAQDIEEIR